MISKPFMSRAATFFAGQVFPLVLIVVLIVVLSAPSLAEPPDATSDSSADSKPLQPVLVLSISKLQGSFEDIGGMFDAAGRSDMREVFFSGLEKNFRDLQGIDRTRPLGGMLFVEEGIPPQLRWIPFLPVEDEEEFVKTMGAMPGRKLTRTGDRTMEWTLGTLTTHVRLVNGYALLLDGDSSFLERRLPDPQTLVGSSAQRFDVACSLHPQNVSPLIRDVFLGMFRAQSDAQLQKRDTESDTGFAARRAVALDRVEMITQVLRDGERVTLGLDAASDGRRVVVDLSLDARPDSEFAHILQNVPGRSSWFLPLFHEQAPLTLSACWNPGPSQLTAMQAGLAYFQERLVLQFPTASDAVDGLFRRLHTEISRAPVDLFLQFVSGTDRHVSLLAGLHLAEPQAMSTALRQFITTVGEAREPGAVEAAVHEHEGLQLHRMQLNPTPGMERVLGQPGLYLGIGENVLWAGLGEADVLPHLDAAVDRLRSEPPPVDRVAPPLQGILRLQPWLNLPSPKGKSSRLRDRAVTAFEPESDGVRLEADMTGTGSRIRLTLDGGFVRLLGLWFAERYDRTQL